MPTHLDDAKIDMIRKFATVAVRNNPKMGGAFHTIGKALKGEFIDPQELAAAQKELDALEKPAATERPAQPTPPKA